MRRKLKHLMRSKLWDSDFLDWVCSMAVLQTYPDLPASDTIGSNVNMVLFWLFKAYLERNVRLYVPSVFNLYGIGVLAKLQKFFIPTTYFDFSFALQDL